MTSIETSLDAARTSARATVSLRAIHLYSSLLDGQLVEYRCVETGVLRGDSESRRNGAGHADVASRY